MDDLERMARAWWDSTAPTTPWEATSDGLKATVRARCIRLRDGGTPTNASDRAALAALAEQAPDKETPAPRKLTRKFYEWADSIPDPGTSILAWSEPPVQAPACSTCDGARTIPSIPIFGPVTTVPCPSCGTGQGGA